MATSSISISRISRARGVGGLWNRADMMFLSALRVNLNLLTFLNYTVLT
jgi:hypothetical protein